MTDEESDRSEHERRPRSGSFRDAGQGDRAPRRSSEGSERRPYAKREGARPAAQRGGAARKPSVKRDDADRKPYARRDGETRKPYEKRDDSGRKPFVRRDDAGRKPYVKRDDSERKPFVKRDDAGRKPYVKRDDSERKPFVKRDDAGRKPYVKRDDAGRKPYARRDDGDRKPYGARGAGAGRPYRTRDDSGRSGFPRRDGDRPSRPRQIDRADRPMDPEIPEEVTARDLGGARNELKTLSKENADTVARHLAMAARLIDDDPSAAHEHALAASRRAGRVALVRETVAITAYAVGDFALALRELRTYRRLTGRDDQIALIVDSERGVGRPDRALEEGRGVDRASLPTETRVHLAIAMSGARLDLGDAVRALSELDIPELDPDRAFAWSPALFDARAEVLDELGRSDEAARWRTRARIAEEALGGGAGDVVEVVDIDEEGGDATDLEIEDGVASDPVREDAAASDADAVADSATEGGDEERS